MKRIGLYPGTFDPVTLGHLDIVKRAVKLVDHLVIGVATNAGKEPLFSLEERVEMVAPRSCGAGHGPRDDRGPIFSNTLQVNFARKCRRCRDHSRPARGVGLRI